MPVEDIEVHELVKIIKTKPYGCSNKPRGHGYYGPGLYILDTMSQLCRYDQRATDKRCGECKLPSDTDYLRSYGL